LTVGAGIAILAPGRYVERSAHIFQTLEGGFYHMRKLILLTAIVAMMSTTAFAAMPVGSIALGWVNMDAPIGIRYQIAEKISGDVGVGFQSTDADRTIINAEIGLPIELIAHNRCSLDFRPGFALKYTSFDEDTWGDIDATTDFTIHGWLVVHYLVTDNFGINAAHGIDIDILDGGEDDSTTNYGSVAGNATSIGWYFWF